MEEQTNVNEEQVSLELENQNIEISQTDEISEEDESEEISFADLGLDEVVLDAITKKGFHTPSPIQVLAIPRLLTGDANLIARARTGTGKTAAFGLPLVQKIREAGDHVRAIVLEPTRELAMQTCTELRSFSSSRYPRVSVVYGGASMGEQIRDLKRGVDIVVGTPGRIQDHIDRGTLDISKIDYFILDEGDEMLDMGFVDDIEKIFTSANPDCRILLFSATMPSEIMKIAQKFMGDYEIVEEEGVTEEPLLIDQKYWVVRESDKVNALVRLIDMADDFYGLVFTQTKMEADMVSRSLDEKGYEVAALHGDIPQNQREKILNRFRNGKTRILVATDVAARGIDISGLSHVVNYALPFDGATYVHRIGRTGRAGSSGLAVTFVRPEEQRRRLNFLRSAVRRASKGEMIQEKIPEIDEVIAVKRERLFANLKAGIEEKCTDEKIVGEESEFSKMAGELLEGKDAKSILSCALAEIFGNKLDKSRYGEIAKVRIEKQRGRGGDFRDDNGQTRLFVQLGRKDGFNPKEIASYFSSLLKIPNRKVDRIDVTENFSLVSLPSESAKLALELSRRDSSVPHMHIDVKSKTQFFQRGRYDSERKRDDRGSFKSRKGFHSSNARHGIRTPTQRSSSAGLYRKKRDDK